MSGENFYQILGVKRTASAEAIRSAYRERVKKYHPDLFADASEKAAATEKLRHINAAWAVLGNAERRRDYDRELGRKLQPDAGSTERARGNGPRAGAAPQNTAGKVIKPKWPVVSKKWAGCGLAVAAASLLFFVAARNEPSLVSAWLLMEKLEVSQARNGSTAGSLRDQWTPVGDYGSVAECVAVLKQKVAQDEREGSRSVYGNQNGTLAITMLIKAEPSIPESANLADRASSDTNGVTIRERTLACRQTQRVKMESWFRRTLNRIGQSQ